MPMPASALIATERTRWLCWEQVDHQTRMTIYPSSSRKMCFSCVVAQVQGKRVFSSMDISLPVGHGEAPRPQQAICSPCARYSISTLLQGLSYRVQASVCLSGFAFLISGVMQVINR